MKTEIILSPDELLKKLTFITPLTTPFREYIADHLKTIELPRRHLLLSMGEVCKNAYFVYQGSLRSFFFNEKNKECTGWFVETGDIMISVYSFFTQRPALEWIETLEPSILQYMSWQEIQNAYVDFSEANRLGRLIWESYYIKCEKRGILLRNSTPEDRYKLCLEEYPDILQKATLTQIASYLGITLETLSRLRNSGLI